jgi:uncharacterized protein YuzE
MRWTCDQTAGALYFYVGSGKPTSQEELADGIVIDRNAGGFVVGVELLGVPSVMPKVLEDCLSRQTIENIRFVLQGLTSTVVPTAVPATRRFKTAEPSDSDDPTKLELVGA